MDPRGLPMYQHPRMTMMGQSDINSVPGSIPINYQMGNPAQGTMGIQGTHMPANHASFTHRTAQQQHYNQLPVRKEVDDKERTTAHLPSEVNDHAHSKNEEKDHARPTTKENYPAPFYTEGNDHAHPTTEENNHARPTTKENYPAHFLTGENDHAHPTIKENDHARPTTKENYPAHFLTGENDHVHPTIKENDPADLTEENDDAQLHTEIKTEVDDDISNFMETAHDIFLKISSKELTIKQASELLGRPYSFVYTRYDEFCDNITGKIITKKKKKGKRTKMSVKERRRARKLKHIRARSKTSGRMFQCEQCPAIFHKEHTLKTHSKAHSGISESHLCTACGIVFSKVCQLMSHRMKIHEDALQCPHCDKQYTVIANYKFHVKSHTKVRPYICDECDKGFWSKPKLEDHYRRHTGEKPFMCGYCEKTFTSIGNLKCHQLIHGERPNVPKTYSFACDQCDSRFNLKANLTRHQAIHTGIKPYQCNYCPAAFVLKTDLARHDMAHTGNKPFKCTFCDYSCVRKPILEYHMNTHTGNKPYKCDFYGCSAEYARPSTLEKHKEKHGPPPLKICKVCNEKFPDINSLKSHMMIHPGNRPVPCDQCDKIFYNESTLKRHMHVHMYKPDGQKPKQVRQRSKNPGVKRASKSGTTLVNLSSEYQRNLSSEYQPPAAAENGQSSRAHSWTINAEDTNSQQSYPTPQSFPANQFTNLNAWPSTMDPDELRRRLLSSFN